jgi:Cu(I)/Ag(I) efflux system membrane fusion protein
VADIFERDADYVRPGAAAVVRYRERTMQARASRNYPQFDPATRTLQIRIELDNGDFALRPGMFVDVEFAVAMPPSLVAPVSAVLDTGRRRLVYLDHGGDWFEPHEVETGGRFGDQVEIVRGLEEGDRIVVEGMFLIDSESRVARGLAGGTEPAIDPVCGMEAEAASSPTSSHRGSTYHFCSRHCKEEFDAHPGKYAGGLKDPIRPVLPMQSPRTEVPARSGS